MAEEERLQLINEILGKRLERLDKLIDRLADTSATILSEFSQALLEKSIHQMLEDLDKRTKRLSTKRSGGGFDL